MSAAFILAALLLCALALAFVLPPLWQGSRRSALALALALPLGVAALYALVGTPAALDAQITAAPAPAESLDEVLDRLATQLRDGSIPDVAKRTEGWVLLGRSRNSQQRHAEARDAFAQANALTPDTPEIMVEYAEALTRTSGSQRIDGAALALLRRALQIDPQQQRALWLMGIHHYQHERWAEVIASWQPLLDNVDAATEALLREQLNIVRGKAGLPPLPVPATGGVQLRVTVELDPALRDKLAPGDTVFVFARQTNGPNMPLAVVKQAAQNFPLRVTLTDADSPMPALKLSSQTQVQLIARVSKSGDAVGVSGDLQSTPLNVATNRTTPVSVLIDHVIQ